MPPSEGKMALFECGIPPSEGKKPPFEGGMPPFSVIMPSSGGKMLLSEGGIRGVATDFLVGGGVESWQGGLPTPRYPKNQKKTLDFGHFILESGGSSQPVFKSAGVMTPDPPSATPLGGMSPPKGRMAPCESGMPPSWADSAAPRQLCPPRNFFLGARLSNYVTFHDL